MTYFRCLEKVARAAGRELTETEIRNIYERIHKAAKDIRADRPIQSQSPQMGFDMSQQGGGEPRQLDELINAAAERAADEMEHEAIQQRRKKQLFLATLPRLQIETARMAATGIDELEAISRLIARDYSGRQDVESIEQRVMGLRSVYLSKLNDLFDALGNDFLGYFQDQTKLTNLLREMKGENTGDAMAKRGAEAWHQVTGELRARFNAAGGDIGHLDDWGFPHHHSQDKVARAGKEKWIEDILPRLDQKRYVDELGDPMDEQAIRSMLDYAWTSIATDGHGHQSKPIQGTGAMANRHKEHRQIHFKSAGDVIDYWRQYGERSALEVIYTHVDTMSRDVAFIEKFSPNPNHMYNTLRAQAMQQATLRDPTQTEHFKGKAVRLDELWNYAAGRTKPTYSLKMRAIAQGISNLAVAGKLGGASIASFFGDKPMLEAVLQLNNVPAFTRWMDELRAMNPADPQVRRLLKQQGLMIDTWRSGVQRFYEGLGASDTTGKMANAVMRATGMNFVNDVRKAGAGVSLFHAIGQELAAGRRFDQLPQSDVRLLRNYGINATDWRVWQLTELRDIEGKFGKDMLVPEAISEVPDDAIIQAGLATDRKGAEQVRHDAVVKLLGAVNTEAEFGVVTPGWRERSEFYGAQQRGTVQGEIGRAVLQFKSFPYSYFKRAMDAYANQRTPQGKAGFVAQLMILNALAGAMIMQVREILSGRDPLDMTTLNFWGKAFLQGGALGIYGDFFYSANQTRYGSGPIEALSGPTLGPLMELSAVQPLAAVRGAMEGEDTHFLAKTLGDVKGFIPFNNAWYLKGAMEHIVWHNVMESLSPGYLRNMRKRTKKEFNQEWYWEPGQFTPDRAPDLGAAAGQ